jgi:hypothetical protein
MLSLMAGHQRDKYFSMVTMQHSPFDTERKTFQIIVLMFYGQQIRSVDDNL